jgi:hypothetical protein
MKRMGGGIRTARQRDRALGWPAAQVAPRVAQCRGDILERA